MKNKNLNDKNKVNKTQNSFKINFKPDLVFIDLVQPEFCLAYKNSSWDSIDCHTPVILQLGDDKLSIYLMKRESWPNASYFLFKSHFSNCSLLFDTPCSSHHRHFESTATLVWMALTSLWQCLHFYEHFHLSFSSITEWSLHVNLWWSTGWQTYIELRWWQNQDPSKNIKNPNFIIKQNLIDF